MPKWLFKLPAVDYKVWWPKNQVRYSIGYSRRSTAQVLDNEKSSTKKIIFDLMINDEMISDEVIFDHIIFDEMIGDEMNSDKLIFDKMTLTQ